MAKLYPAPCCFATRDWICEEREALPSRSNLFSREISFYLQSVGNKMGLNEGHCRHWCPLQEQLKSQQFSPEGRCHTTVPALPAIAKDMPGMKPPQAFKRQLTFLAYTTDWCTLGRGGEGGCQCLGKLAALRKRLLLCESSQGAAIIPAKANRAVLGSPGGTAQLVLCLLGS